jgi:hypothetical protein
VATLVFSSERCGIIPCWGAPHTGQASAFGPISAPQQLQNAAIIISRLLVLEMDDAPTAMDSPQAKMEGAGDRKGFSRMGQFPEYPSLGKEQFRQNRACQDVRAMGVLLSDSTAPRNRSKSIVQSIGHS